MRPLYNFFAILCILLQVPFSIMGAIFAGGAHHSNILEAYLLIIWGSTALTAAIPCIYMLIRNVVFQTDLSHKEKGIGAAIAIFVINFLMFSVVVGSQAIFNDWGAYWKRASSILLPLLLLLGQYILTVKFEHAIRRSVTREQTINSHRD